MAERKVLLVDDVEFFLDVERSFLSHTPATILVARNGREALDVAARERPNLIFLDVHMPVMDGLACCRALKSDSRLQDIPVIMVFAPSGEVTPATCLQAGCSGVLTKPLNRKEFLDLGHKFLFQIDRRERRVPARPSVALRRTGKEITGIGEDISEHGMYISCREEVAANEILRLSLLFPGAAQPLEIRGRVAWVNQGYPRPKVGLPQGFGVEFLNPDAVARAVLREQVEREEAGEGRRDGVQSAK